jgi:Microfibril-associated/Pre-mRNA processing
MSAPPRPSAGFGRDEMNALVGGGDSLFPEHLTRPALSKTTTRRTTTATTTDQHGKSTYLGDLSAAETAAMLRQNKTTAKTAAKAVPHRTAASSNGPRPLRNYEKLLQEQLQQPILAATSTRAAVAYHDLEPPVTKSKRTREHSSLDEEKTRDSQPVARRKIAPVIIMGRAAAASHDVAPVVPLPSVQHRRRRRRDSSSESEKRKSSSESDSSSASSNDAAQRRDLIRRRRQNGPSHSALVDQTIGSPRDDPDPPHSNDPDHGDTASTVPLEAGLDTLQPRTSLLQKNDQEIASTRESSSESSSASTSDESESDSASEQGTTALLRFVPRHERGHKAAPKLSVATVAAMAPTAEQERKLRQEQEEQRQRRQYESRALVQKVVTEAKKAQQTSDEALEGIQGARNEPPDDTDVLSDNDDDSLAAERDAWQVRELARLLQEYDLEFLRQQEERERLRRSRLTDEEYLAERANYYGPSSSQQHHDLRR